MYTPYELIAGALVDGISGVFLGDAYGLATPVIKLGVGHYQLTLHNAAANYDAVFNANPIGPQCEVSITRTALGLVELLFTQGGAPIDCVFYIQGQRISIGGVSGLLPGLTSSAGYANQPDWWIDPIFGSDSATGAQLTPLRTHEELRRRIGDSVINQFTTVHLMNDFPVTNPVWVRFNVGPLGSLFYKGEFFITRYTSPLGLTGVTLVNRTNVPTPGGEALLLTDANLPAGWSASGAGGSTLINFSFNRARRMRFTSGANVGAVCWLAKDMGANVARSSPVYPVTPPPNFLTGQLTPAVGDQYVIEFVTQIGDFDVDVVASDIRTSFMPPFAAQNISLPALDPSTFLNTPASIRVLCGQVYFPGATFVGCGMGQAEVAGASGAGISGMECGGCLFQGSFSLVGKGAAFYLSCLVRTFQCALDGGTLRIAGDTLFQDTSLFVESGEVRGQNYGLFDLADPFGFGQSDGFQAAIVIHPGAYIFNNSRDSPDPGIIYGNSSDASCATGWCLLPGSGYVYAFDPATSVANGQPIVIGALGAGSAIQSNFASPLTRDGNTGVGTLHPYTGVGGLPFTDTTALTQMRSIY